MLLTLVFTCVAALAILPFYTTSRLCFRPESVALLFSLARAPLVLGPFRVLPADCIGRRSPAPAALALFLIAELDFSGLFRNRRVFAEPLQTL